MVLTFYHFLAISVVLYVGIIMFVAKDWNLESTCQCLEIPELSKLVEVGRQGICFCQSFGSVLRLPLNSLCAVIFCVRRFCEIFYEDYKNYSL